MDPLLEALARKRLDMGLTHTEFARLIGVGRTTWFDALAGREPVGRAIRLGATKFEDLAALELAGRLDTRTAPGEAAQEVAS